MLELEKIGPMLEAGNAPYLYCLCSEYSYVFLEGWSRRATDLLHVDVKVAA